MEQTLEICRWVYNETLAMRKNAWEQEQKCISSYESKRQIPLWEKERPELSTVYSQVLQDVSMRVDLAFKAFFRRVKAGENPGYPRFKGKGRYGVSRIRSRGSNSMMPARTSPHQRLAISLLFSTARLKVTLRLSRFAVVQPGNGMPVSRSSMNPLLYNRMMEKSGSMSVSNHSPPFRMERRSRTPGSSVPMRRSLQRRRENSRKRRRALLNGRRPERSSHTSMNGSLTDGSILLIKPPVSW